jgi:hypothetical protein
MNTGSSYHALAEVNDTDKFDIVQSGMMGERVPIPVTNLTLVRDGVNASFKTEREGIRFDKGNYTIGYDGRISGNAFQILYTDPVQVTITLPGKYKVDNPLLTSIQPSGSNISQTQNETIIRWDKTRYIDLRYYDAGQETLLSIFGQFWFIIAIMLLLPFIFSYRRQV